MYFLLKHDLNHLPVKQVIQKSRVTLKAGDTIKIRTNKEETWDKIGSVIAPNNCPGSYVLNVKGNFVIRNHRHLISTNKDFFVKRDYENITQLSKVTSRKTVTSPRTDIPSNIVASSEQKVDTLLGIHREYFEEC